MQIYKAFKKDTIVNGMLKTVVVTIDFETEDFDGRDMERDDVLEIERKIERLQLDCIWLRVRASFSDLDHIEGQDSLGQVLVSKRSDMDETVSEYDMVTAAIDDLKTNTFDAIAKTNAFLGVEVLK